MARTDAQHIAASGRTLEEHRDIARALETDPRGSRSARLDFESGDFSGWSVRRLAKNYSAAIQGEIVRSGTKACRFEIRPGDRVSQGFRAPPKGVGVVLAQWHDQAELGDPAGKPPLAIRYMDGALRFTGAFSEVASQDPDRRYVFREIPEIARETWLDFAFGIHWSRKGDSSIDAFLGGERIFRFDGPLGYRNEIKGPYFKLGVYASGEITTPLVVYHDNDSRADSFAAVDPGATHVPADKA